MLAAVRRRRSVQAREGSPSPERPSRNHALEENLIAAAQAGCAVFAPDGDGVPGIVKAKAEPPAEVAAAVRVGLGHARAQVEKAVPPDCEAVAIMPAHAHEVERVSGAERGGRVLRKDRN